VKLATALKSFDGRSAFSTWLYRITLNAVRDLQRTQGRRGRQVGALQAVSPTDQPADQEEATTIGNYGARCEPCRKNSVTRCCWFMRRTSTTRRRPKSWLQGSDGFLAHL